MGTGTSPSSLSDASAAVSHRSPFDRLRANGVGLVIADDYPFVLSLSKHRYPLCSTLLKEAFGMDEPGDFLEPLSQARSRPQRGIRTAAVEPVVTDRR